MTKQRTNAELLDLIAEWRRNAPRHPTSASVIQQITSEPLNLPPNEAQGEINATTAEDYDYWVECAFHDLVHIPPRIYQHPENPKLIECPRKRVLRIGEESIKQGKPSALYQYILEITNNGETLPRVTKRALDSAQSRLLIAYSYKYFFKLNPKLLDFKAAKKKFRSNVETGLIKDIAKIPSQAAVDDALAEHNMNWSAYGIDAARKGQRNKKP